ncbi:MAG: carbohydrate porin [Bacteroidales bacterium]|nr:carbohydrate porin [Bacteroidales bacterium]
MMQKLMLTRSFVILLVVMISFSSAGQEKDNSLDASITQDITSNMAGGLKTGQAQLGLISLDFTLNTEQMNLWGAGMLRVQIQNTYGQRPTEQLVGDLQVFNNIENGNYTYLHQFWYKQEMGDFWLLAGKHDLNEQFFTGQLAGSYINSSFGIMPVASLNVPVSIFPATTLGLIAHYAIDPKWSVQAAVYNGIPGEITRSNFGMDLNLNLGHGLFYIGEVHLQNLSNWMDGTYKVGAFHHSGSFPSLTQPDIKQKGASGMYLLADQRLYNPDAEGNKGLGAFLQLGYSPDNSSINDFYGALGLNYRGIWSRDGKDELGLALAHASIRNGLLQIAGQAYRSCETVAELTYQYSLTDHLKVQPDIQYIIHPGMVMDRDNAWAGTLRIKWSYQ